MPDHLSARPRGDLGPAPQASAAVQHSIGTYVTAKTHTNGIESFWSMLKRGYQGTYHQ